MICPAPASALLSTALLQAGGDFAASPEGRETAASGPVDWVLLGLAVAAVIVVVFLCAKYFLRPGEGSPDHIKRRVLRDETEREETPPV